jgi:hypothetical protein
MSDAELRTMVREVLREALAQKKGSGSPVQSAVPAAPVGALPERSPVSVFGMASEAVSIANDADLVAFVHRLVTLLDDPARAASIRSGRHRFTLAVAAPSPSGVPAHASGSSARENVTVVEGVISEAKLNRLKGVKILSLAPGAVLTPLARDRARALGLVIERKS